MHDIADHSRWIALFCAIIIGALYAIGFASGTALRHVVQTAPLWICVVLGFKRVRAVRWLALPMLVFWLGIMVVIWMFLLGWTRVISGHFSPVEIAMTIVIGAASANGIKTCLGRPWQGTAFAGAGFFLMGALCQWAAFYISFLPRIANR
jgi:hypothetical protein